MIGGPIRRLAQLIGEPIKLRGGWALCSPEPGPQTREKSPTNVSPLPDDVRVQPYECGAAHLQSIVQKLLVDVAKHAPESALSALVNDVLADPSNWEPTLVGLQALLTILFDGPQHTSHPQVQQVQLPCLSCLYDACG